MGRDIEGKFPNVEVIKSESEGTAEKIKNAMTPEEMKKSIEARKKMQAEEEAPRYEIQ